MSDMVVRWDNDEQVSIRRDGLVSDVVGRLARIRDSYAYGADSFDREHWDETVDKINALWAAGVEEGRRQAAEERATKIGQALGDAHFAGVEEGRRQQREEFAAESLKARGLSEERTKVEYGVRVDAVHPLRKEKVGTVMTHLGEQKSRMCHDIWDGWTPVKRTVRPAVHGQWEALDEAERLRAPWKHDAEAVDHG